MTHTLASPGDATTHAAAPTTAALPNSGPPVNPNMNAPLTGCVTIDSTKPDGYLSNARSGTPGAAANSSVQMAAQVLGACLAGKKPPVQSISIVGHGHSGIIVTGTGQQRGDKDHHIALDNTQTWIQAFSPLKGTMTNAFLYGCHVGMGPDGAKLLFDVAQTLGCNVYGPTGLIYCDGGGDFALEPFSQWQMATPQQEPAPIAAPPVITPSEAGGLEVRLHVLENVVITTLDQLSHAFLDPHPATGWTSVPVALVEQLVREVLWHKPFAPIGQHAALFTGRLHLHFGHGERAIEKVFSVFNHTLLQDEDHPGIFYRASSKWHEFLV